MLLSCTMAYAQSTDDFITTWTVSSSNLTITIPTNSNKTYDYIVDWGDGSEASEGLTGDATHTYASAGTYTVSISGTFPQIYFNNSGSKDNIVSIEQWGNIQWESMFKAFKGCSNLTLNATDAPDLSNATSLVQMFRNATSLTTNEAMNTWNTSTITNMWNVFNGATNFNQDISNWDVSNVTKMGSTFRNTSFNQDLSNWDISNVTTMQTMFTNSKLSPANYDKILIGWASLPSLQSDVNFGVNGLTYCSGATARQTIIDTYNWSFNSDIQDCSFITTWLVPSDNYEIKIPTTGSGYDYTVDWGDGTIEANFTGNAKHTYATAGTYTVKVSGDFPRIHFNGQNSANDILTIEQWGDIQWETMDEAFYDCVNLTLHASDAPDLSQVKNMNQMFWGATSMNSDLNHWDMSNVEETNAMFYEASAFNGDISSWNLSNVNNMRYMFFKAHSFNGDISNWDVSNVTNMEFLFYEAESFNGELNNWNTSSVTNMRSMFNRASSFNQDLSNWDVSNVISMRYTFSSASSFNQSLADWDISRVRFAMGMLNNSNLSTYNYDKTLTGWAQLNLFYNIEIGAAGLTYCYSFEDRESIENNGIRFIDDLHECNDFTSTWQVNSDGESITIPTNSDYTYDYRIDWGDGSDASEGVTGDATHTYATAGTYTIRILGDFPAIRFQNSASQDNILEITQWGEIEWESMHMAFSGCSNLQVTASDAPDLSNSPSLFGIFSFASSFDQDISHWDVSIIEDMRFMFYETPFNQDISNWNTSNVTQMNGMFAYTTAFNQDISSWDLANVESMHSLFRSAAAFNQDISSWNTAKVTTMYRMFYEASVFDQSLANWDISSVALAEGMFDNSGLSTLNYDATLAGWTKLDLVDGLTIGVEGLEYCDGSSRQNIIDNQGWTFDGDAQGCTDAFTSTWNVSAGENIIILINDAQTYDYNYTIYWGDGSADTGLTEHTSHTYTDAGTYTIRITGDFPAIYFNNAGSKTNIQDITQWGSIEWETMENAFKGCSNLTISAEDAPDLSRVTSLKGMFQNSGIVSGNLNNWNVSNVTNMSYMFNGASSFNEDLNDWDVSNVTTMAFMFTNANAFNGNVSAWNISSLTQADQLFYNASAFDQNLGNWDISNITSITQFIAGTNLSITNYDATLIGWAGLSLHTGQQFMATGLTYCNGSTARQYIKDTYHWSFYSDNYECKPFTSTWTVADGETITIPTNSSFDTYNYDVDWGDGSTPSSGETGDASHTYTTAGTYTIEISGDFPAIYFNKNGNHDNITDITQWGTIAWESMDYAFYGCSNLNISATDAPNLLNTTSMRYTFSEDTTLTADLNHWNVSTITDMYSIFREATNFNGDISDWDMSNVTDMSYICRVPTSNILIKSCG